MLDADTEDQETKVPVLPGLPRCSETYRRYLALFYTEFSQTVQKNMRWLQFVLNWFIDLTFDSSKVMHAVEHEHIIYSFIFLCLRAW